MQQSLRWIARSVPALPEALADFIPSFKIAFGNITRGTFFRDTLAFLVPDSLTYNATEESNLDLATVNRLEQFYLTAETIQTARIRSKAITMKSIRLGGIHYKPFDISPGDSYVIARIGNSECPGRILRIFRHARNTEGGARPVETFVELEKFKMLGPDESAKDPYRKIRSGGCLYADAFEKQTELIPASRIMTHFALSRRPSGLIKAITVPHVHVLPLEKVSPFPHRNLEFRLTLAGRRRCISILPLMLMS